MIIDAIEIDRIFHDAIKFLRMPLAREPLQEKRFPHYAFLTGFFVGIFASIIVPVEIGLPACRSIPCSMRLQEISSFIRRAAWYVVWISVRIVRYACLFPQQHRRFEKIEMSP